MHRRKESRFKERKCASITRESWLYLDIVKQLPQGHFLLPAASALNKEVIPHGVRLSCDLPMDMLHTQADR